MTKLLFIASVIVSLSSAAKAECSFGVDPTTGQYTQICGGPETGGQQSSGCYFGVDPTNGQYRQVCR